VPNLSGGIDQMTDLLRNPLEAFPLMESLLNSVTAENGQNITSAGKCFILILFFLFYPT
jgi:hypothetical protein